ncbi:Ribosomal protein L37, mitochondrial [Ceraceosorus bombacis]|uniref:Large ribosomal subunit protein mL54 n=1 Tax=Ceraceosorus bombacis TaxID=401625 RepID=A0A0P1BMY9_9BASI|nr:Ribosomal protein L37, mitochondrial [Ceraceosorus bombacis]
MASRSAPRSMVRTVLASTSTASQACACRVSSAPRMSAMAILRHYSSPSEPKRAEAGTAATEAGPSSTEALQQAAAAGYGPPAGIVSSCPEGTVLKGLALLKDQPEPVALPDASYPTWLWSLAGTTGGGSDVTSLGAAATKGELRIALKRAKKAKRLADAKASKTAAQAQQVEEVPKTPEEIKRQLRKKNRERIKASNFVKAA